MEISYNSKELNSNRRIYMCFNCGKCFNWTKESVWYGSYLMLENNPKKIKYFCTEKCYHKYNTI